MRFGLWVAIGVTVSCQYEPLPMLSHGDATSADAAPVALKITASRPGFVLHATEVRDTLLTVTNPTTQTSGAPTLEATGLTLATLTFESSTCTAPLAPGASCTAIARLTASSVGETTFQVTASATTVEAATVSLSLRVMPACAVTCGPSGTTNCCASAIVPGSTNGATAAGTVFYRGFDAAADTFNDNGNPATISDFRLDTYEVTVGRFRTFVAAGMGTQQNPPAAGAGAHEAIAATGWDASWNANLTADTTALTASIKCATGFETWTDTAGPNDNLPMNCITWYEAMAFCAWDGGFLATETEMNYAAAGGSEQRVYPWSNPVSSTAIDCSYANYLLDSPPGTYCVNGTTNGANRVGSESPKGDGKWGHADLSGNVWEWALDWSGPYANPCDNCANLTPSGNRVLRGGAFNFNATYARVANRIGSNSPSLRDVAWGVRCARAP